MPVLRELWKHIGKRMPKGNRRSVGNLDPLSLPLELTNALEALYGHYAKTYKLWQEAGIQVPPCFIVVCNNTATSKLVYDYISGFVQEHDDGTSQFHNGRLKLFQNYDQQGTRLARPRTLLIDSEQLESGDALDRNFRKLAADEIDRFRRDIVERTRDLAQAENLTDQDLLREVMNTVGKPGQLGDSIRCVVSVSMLTEGWDANSVTHILGVRAFGTQLLCEQAVGRALRRQSYELNAEGLFDVEYADVLGIPFDFTAKPVVIKPKPPRETVQVRAISPERDACEIRFPRVEGYRVELPKERLQADFTDDSTYELKPEVVGPTETRNQGLIGEGVDLTVEHLGSLRPNALEYQLTWRMLETKWRDAGEAPKLHLFGQLRQITRQWLDQHLVCKGGTYPAQLMHRELADIACERITDAVTRSHQDENPVKAILDPYNPAGSTRYVRFSTSKPTRWQTDPRRCHVNWAVCDGDWEAEFCRVVEKHPKVLAYVKNQGLGLEAPYRMGSVSRRYIPDFILLVDDGRVDDQGQPDPLRLVVEIKGYRGEDAKVKKSTMETYWVPGVNGLGSFGRWKFAEFTDVYALQDDLEAEITAHLDEIIATAAREVAGASV